MRLIFEKFRNFFEKSESPIGWVFCIWAFWLVICGCFRLWSGGRPRSTRSPRPTFSTLTRWTSTTCWWFCFNWSRRVSISSFWKKINLWSYRSIIPLGFRGRGLFTVVSGSSSNLRLLPEPFGRPLFPLFGFTVLGSSSSDPSKFKWISHIRYFFELIFNRKFSRY